MTLRYRRIIYLVFIAVFLIIAPIITLYSTGYRYNFKKNKIEKTGILNIDSQPRGALIYLNGQYQNKTPARFTNLLPDRYQVKVEKDGYYPWQKDLEVKSNLTTFAKDIVLFKQNLPVNIVAGEINIFEISPNQGKIIYSLTNQNTEELRLINLKNQSDSLIQQLNNRSYNQLEFVGWSPSQNKALLKEVIGDFNQYLIVDAVTLEIKELFDVTRLNFSQVNWPDSTDNYLYGLRQAVLYQIDLANNSSRTLLSANIDNFQIKGEEIYLITKIGSQAFLDKTSLQNQKISEIERIKLPSPSEYTLQPSNPGNLVLLDKKNNDLFIITADSFAAQDISQNIILQDKAKKIVWSKDFKIILYYTDFEISTFNFEKKQKNLVTRYGEIIDQALWYPDNKYVIYRLKNSIRAIEAESDESKNDLELTKLSTVDSMVTDDSGKNLYFKGKAGNQPGIYRLEIQ